MFNKGDCNSTKLGNTYIAKHWWPKSLVDVDNGDDVALSTLNERQVPYVFTNKLAREEDGENGWGRVLSQVKMMNSRERKG